MKSMVNLKGLAGRVPRTFFLSVMLIFSSGIFSVRSFNRSWIVPSVGGIVVDFAHLGVGGLGDTGTEDCGEGFACRYRLN